MLFCLLFPCGWRSAINREAASENPPRPARGTHRHAMQIFCGIARRERVEQRQKGQLIKIKQRGERGRRENGKTQEHPPRPHDLRGDHGPPNQRRGEAKAAYSPDTTSHTRVPRMPSFWGVQSVRSLECEGLRGAAFQGAEGKCTKTLRNLPNVLEVWLYAYLRVYNIILPRVI